MVTKKTIRKTSNPVARAKYHWAYEQGFSETKAKELILTYKTSVERRLGTIYDMLSTGSHVNDVCKQIKVARRVFDTLIECCPELSALFANAITDRDTEVESAMYKSAIGVAESQQTVEQYDKDGNLQFKTHYINKLAPNVKAAEFLLTNTMPDKYKKTGNQTLNINGVMTLAEIEKRLMAVKTQIGQVEYTIEDVEEEEPEVFDGEGDEESED